MNELTDLRKRINSDFSLGEIKVICFDLGISIEALSGETKDEKIVSLIEYCERRHILSDLIEICSEQNSHFDFVLKKRVDSRPEIGEIITKLGLSIPTNQCSEYESVIHEYLDVLLREFNLPAITSSLHDADKIYVKRKLTTFVKEPSSRPSKTSFNYRSSNLDPSTLIENEVPQDNDDSNLDKLHQETHHSSSKSGISGESSLGYIRKEVSQRDLINSRFGKYSIVFGDPGMGKSTLMRQLVLECIQSLRSGLTQSNSSNLELENKNVLLPITVECGAFNEFSSLKSKSIIEQATSFLSKFQQEKMEDVMRAALKNGSAILIIDGLDEINLPKIYDDLEKSIYALIKGNEVPVLITSRNSGYRQETFASFTKFYLSPFSEAEQKDFLWEFYNTGDASKKNQTLTNFLEFIEGKSWAGDPFFLAIACEGGFVERISQNKRDVNERDLVEAFLENTLRKYENRFSIDRNQRSKIKEYLFKSLSILAIELRETGQETIDYNQSLQLLESHFDHEIAKKMLTIFSEEFSRIVNPPNSESGDKFKFKHLIFEYYFAAKHIESQNDVDLVTGLLSLFSAPRQEVYYDQEWVEVTKFVLTNPKLASDIKASTNFAAFIFQMTQQDSRFLDLAATIVLNKAFNLNSELQIEFFQLFVNICVTELSERRKSDLSDLDEIPELNKRFVEFVNSDLHELLIQAIVNAHDECPNDNVFYFGRLAEHYSNNIRKVRKEEVLQWKDILDIIENRSDERQLHIITTHSLPYSASDYPQDKLNEIIDALVIALKSKSSFAVAKTLSIILSEKENLTLLSETNFNQVTEVLKKPDCHPYTRFNLVKCIRRLLESDFLNLISTDRHLIDIIIDELDSEEELNPVGAAVTLHKLGHQSPRVNERLIDGLIHSGNSSYKLELVSALSEGWFRENSRKLYEKIIKHEDPDIRGYALQLLKAHANNEMTRGVIDDIRNLNDPVVNKVLHLAQSDEDMIISHLLKPEVLVCVILEGQIILTPTDQNGDHKFQKGYIYLAIHLDQFQKLLQDIFEKGLINPKDYRSTILAKHVGMPSNDVIQFMRRKFGFSDYEIVIQKEEEITVDPSIFAINSPAIIDPFLDQSFNIPSTTTINDSNIIIEKDDESDIPIHSIDFMRIGSGYIHKTDDSTSYRKRFYLFQAYTNFINQNFLPGDPDLLCFEDIDVKDPSEQPNKESYDEALQNIVVHILVEGIRAIDDKKGYLYLSLPIIELNKIFKALCKIGYFDPKEYELTVLDADIGSPPSEVWSYHRTMYGFSHDRLIIQYDGNTKPNDLVSTYRHKIVDRFFSTRPLNFKPFTSTNVENIVDNSEINNGFVLHSFTSLRLGSGYIYEAETKEIYATRVEVLSSYADHINSTFSEEKKQKIEFEKCSPNIDSNKYVSLDGNSTIKNVLKKRQLDINYAKSMAQRGFIKIDLNLYESAISDLDKSIELDDSFAKLFAKRGYANRNENRLEEALRDFNKATELSLKYTWAIGEKGLTLRLMKQYEEALETFDAALKIDPKYKWAIGQKGVTYREMEQYENALAEFNNALDLDPKYTWIIGQKGVTYQEMKQYEEALETLDAALKIDPKYKWAIGQKGVTYREMEQYENALTEFNHALDLDPKYTWAIDEKGETLRLMERHEEALETFDAALRIDPKYKWAIVNKAVIYRDSKNYESAIIAFNQAIAIDASYIWAWSEKGLTLLLTESHIDEAINCLNEAVALSTEKETPYSYVDRAILHLVINSPEAAWADLQKFLDSVTNNLEGTQNETKVMHTSIAYWLLDQQETSTSIIQAFLQSNYALMALRSESKGLKKSWKAALKITSVSIFFDMINQQLKAYQEKG